MKVNAVNTALKILYFGIAVFLLIELLYLYLSIFINMILYDKNINLSMIFFNLDIFKNSTIIFDRIIIVTFLMLCFYSFLNLIILIYKNIRKNKRFQFRLFYNTCMLIVLFFGIHQMFYIFSLFDFQNAIIWILCVLLEFCILTILFSDILTSISGYLDYSEIFAEYLKRIYFIIISIITLNFFLNHGCIIADHNETAYSSSFSEIVFILLIGVIIFLLAVFFISCYIFVLKKILKKFFQLQY